MTMLYRFALPLAVLSLLSTSANGENLRGRELSLFRVRSTVSVKDHCSQNNINLNVQLIGGTIDAQSSVVKATFSYSGTTTHVETLCGGTSGRPCSDLRSQEEIETSYAPVNAGAPTVQLTHYFLNKRNKPRSRDVSPVTSFNVLDSASDTCSSFAAAAVEPTLSQPEDIFEACYGDSVSYTATFDSTSMVSAELACGIPPTPVESNKVFSISGESVTFDSSNSFFDQAILNGNDSNCFVRLFVDGMQIVDQSLPLTFKQCTTTVAPETSSVTPESTSAAPETTTQADPAEDADPDDAESDADSDGPDSEASTEEDEDSDVEGVSDGDEDEDDDEDSDSDSDVETTLGGIGARDGVSGSGPEFQAASDAESGSDSDGAEGSEDSTEEETNGGEDSDSDSDMTPAGSISGGGDSSRRV